MVFFNRVTRVTYSYHSNTIKTLDCDVKHQTGTLPGYKKSKRENLEERPFYFLEKSPLVNKRKGAEEYRLENKHFVMYARSL